MSDSKTKRTDVDVTAWLAALEPASRRADAEAICALLASASGAAPEMWGDNIIGFGTCSYHYASGRKGVWLRIGFAPRKGQCVVYLMDGFDGQADLLPKLGKVRTGASCLYIPKLSAINTDVLAEMARRSWVQMGERYPET